MNIAEIDYTKYARLLIKSGVGLVPGQKLSIRYHPGGTLLARRCGEIAYEEGASLVDFRPRDLHVQKARIRAQAKDDKALGTTSSWIGAWEDAVFKEDWAFLALESFDDVGIMADVDQDAVAKFEKFQLDKIRRYREGVISHAFPWCLAAVPGDGWAKRVLGDGKNAIDLWNVLKPILLLDQPNIVDAWKEKDKILHRRRDALNALNLDSLRFLDQGTDLKIGLLSASIWVGGGRNAKGRSNIPNIPTEEVFTTPDRCRCDGRVRATRPVEVRGTMVKDAEFTFKNGVVTAFTASQGQDTLKAYLDSDEGSKHLGEVALVGEDSPIAKSGLIFDSILYDENASCHIALGAGYTNCVAGGNKLTDKSKKEAAGCNHSSVHRDFMIGSPSTRVLGVDTKGNEIEILNNGQFMI